MAAIEQIFEYSYPANGSPTQVVIADIPQTYEHLEIIMYGKRAPGSYQSGEIKLLLNGSSTNGHYYTELFQAGSTAPQGTNSNATCMAGHNSNDSFNVQDGGSGGVWMIYSYSDSTHAKTCFFQGNRGGTPNNQYDAFLTGTNFRPYTPITSITFTASTQTNYGGSKIWINGWNEFANA